MTRPTTLPTWATDANFSSGPNNGDPTKVEPSAGEKAQGFVPGATFLSDFANWVVNNIGDSWIAHLDLEACGGVYGDGSDGAGSISGGTTTLARDMYYETLEIDATGTLRTAGFRVHVRDTLTIEAGGLIHDNGADGQDGVDNTGGAGGTIHGQETLAQQFAGGNGGDDVQPGSAGNNATVSIGGAGGTGGQGDTAGGPQAGGAGGTVTAPINDDGGAYVLRAVPQAPLGRDLAGNRVGGGSGGGGGGGGRTSGTPQGGGGGGTGGGVVMIAARLIVNAGAIQADGGDGGDGGSNASSTGGGGAGGGGGTVVLVRRARTGAGTVTAAGGTGGSPGTGQPGSTAGANGAAGVVIEITA